MAEDRLSVVPVSADAGATALEQARAAGTFTAVHDAWWAAACKAHGDEDGTRARYRENLHLTGQ